MDSCLLFRSLSHLSLFFCIFLQDIAPVSALAALAVQLFPGLFIEETSYFLLDMLFRFAEDELTIGLGVHFWVLSSDLLISYVCCGSNNTDA